MISIMATHISSCLWIFFSQLAAEDDATWMDGDIKDLPLKSQYLTAFYFTITTFSTVGYGDISANNPYEQVFCILIMCIGVTAFAAGTSSLTNLLSSFDHENAKFQESVNMLNKIYKNYCLPLSLYENVKKSLKCHH